MFNQSFKSSEELTGWAEKKQTTEEPRYVESFDIGDSVEQPLFGKGKIVDTDGDDVAISFGTKGVKKLNTNFAPLKKL